MATKPPLGTGRALVPSNRARTAIARRLAAAAGSMTTAVTQAMDTRVPWFRDLGAEERSWITLVARAGIDSFAGWFGDDTDPAVDPLSIFQVAPRAMTRQISLQQTVDLVRTTVDVLEEQIGVLMPKSDRAPLASAIVQYSRDVAFAAAEVYAGAAESRAAWDERIEAIIIDAIVRDEVDDTVIARASTLGWPATSPTCVLVGHDPGDAATSRSPLDTIRQAAARAGLAALCAVQGDRLVVVLAGTTLVDDVSAAAAVERLADLFAPGPVVVGCLTRGLAASPRSADEALSGMAASPGWAEGPRLRPARNLLPERALLGHPAARTQLVEGVYAPLAAAGGDLLETCVSFLDHSGSVEASARALYVHANTIRYRIKRIDEVTGYSPADARDAYVLRLAITLGRLAPA
ncbi:MAG: helix-turn-helix domain-containing protein [Actinomycetia bacterium]|nr:helix-turn-helix domain-containing protein [Actinomycetes bacterium]